MTGPQKPEFRESNLQHYFPLQLSTTTTNHQGMCADTSFWQSWRGTLHFEGIRQRVEMRQLTGSPTPVELLMYSCSARRYQRDTPRQKPFPERKRGYTTALSHCP